MNLFDIKPVVEKLELDGLPPCYIRQITSREKDKFDVDRFGSNLGNVRAQLIALAVCDADGNRVYGDNDLDKLGDLPAWVARPIYDAIWKLNKFDSDLEESKKNSTATPQDSGTH